jgi:hypothetical protein
MGSKHDPKIASREVEIDRRVSVVDARIATRHGLP